MERDSSGPTECDKCGDPAVMHAAYSGLHLCETHFRRSVEKRVRRRVREDGLVPDDATPEDPETWVIGLSGGKDSVVLTRILHETFARDPRIELVALSIHEGIDGYRDRSLAACEDLTEDLDVAHEVVAYEGEYGVRMDEVVEDDPMEMAACAYCGVFRRDALERYARELGADKLLTGHNLDDEAETALMNVLEGDVEQMAQHFEASLGPFASDGDGPADRARREQDHHVPRAKPLRDVPEREVALYAQLRDLPMHHAECPHADESFRGEVQDLLLSLEADHPGTRHSIMAGYETMAALAAAAFGGEEADVGTCEACGAPTPRDRCRTCALLDALDAEDGRAVDAG
ncbi:MAG: TIGR00269 family protein [Haloarculaceae archaeon]